MTALLDWIKLRAGAHLTPAEKLLATMRSCGRDGRLWRWSSRLLAVYPADVTAADHRQVAWWRRAVSTVGVWVSLCDDIFAYRHTKRGTACT